MNGPPVQVHRREGERRSPDPGDLRAIYGGHPTACQSRPGQGPDRPSRPGRHAGPRGQEAGDDHLGAPREALEEFRAAGRLQPQLASSLALSGQVTGWLLATQARLG
jgi:hypothetical protein